MIYTIPASLPLARNIPVKVTDLRLCFEEDICVGINASEMILNSFVEQRFTDLVPNGRELKLDLDE